MGSALLAGSSIGLFGWDITKPQTLNEVNTKGNIIFKPKMDTNVREKKVALWKRAVERSRRWEEGVDDE